SSVRLGVLSGPSFSLNVVFHNICDWAKRFRKPAYWYPLQVGYDRPVGEAVYAIDDFPDDDLLWRIEWIGGVGYNTSVPSDPLMDVCIAQPPAGETNPLSARFCTVANNVGDSVALNLAFNKKVARPIVFQKVHCKLARFRFISETVSAS